MKKNKVVKYYVLCGIRSWCDYLCFSEFSSAHRVFYDFLYKFLFSVENKSWYISIDVRVVDCCPLLRLYGIEERLVWKYSTHIIHNVDIVHPVNCQLDILDGCGESVKRFLILLHTFRCEYQLVGFWYTDLNDFRVKVAGKKWEV